MNPHTIPGERLEHPRQLEAHLSDQIRGQDRVIPRVVSVLEAGTARVELVDEKESRCGNRTQAHPSSLARFRKTATGCHASAPDR